MTSLYRTTLVLALALLLGGAADSWALTIYFKDGSQEIIAQSYRIEGDKVMATLPSSQVISLPLAAVDLAKTEELNKVAKGSARVLEGVEGPEGEPARERTLADLMRDRPASPEVAPQPAESRALRRTPSGNVDLLTMARRPLPGDRGDAILTLLAGKGLRDAEVYQGTGSGRVLVDVVTATRGEVFAALESCAAGFAEIQTEFPDIEALEIAMATATRSRAGQFVLTAADAERLATGAVTPAEHFVAKVLF